MSSLQPPQSSDGESEIQNPQLKIYVRILSGGDVALGPGKADLMTAIAEQGSISRAGQSLGISYRRVWNMVEAINNGFEPPLIVTSHGGVGGGGARLSETGQFVLSRYRAMQAAISQIAAEKFEDIRIFVRSRQ